MDTETRRLSADDLAYLKVVMGQRVAAETAAANYSGYLAQKYQIGPNDTVDELGNIVTLEEPVED